MYVLIKWVVVIISQYIYVYICIHIHKYMRRAWQPTPVFLPGESHGQRSLAD